MIILFFIVLLFKTSSGLSLSSFKGLSQRQDKAHTARKWIIIKDEGSNRQIIQQNDLGKQVLAVFEFNHQECDMVLKSGRRRRVQCHDEIPNHGRDIGLLQPFTTVAKWLQHH